MKLKSPYPFFGGKSRAAQLIWSRLGNVKNFIEPFAGSLAVLLARPHNPELETINDLDRHISNFWRSVKADPDAVAHYADRPVNEADLEAIHQHLVSKGYDKLQSLLVDPEAHDAKLAGWWVYGCCAWIGSGWCSGNGPWVMGENGWEKTEDGKGVARQLPHMGGGKGIQRVGIVEQSPHLGNQGQGINRKLPSLRNAGMGVNRQLPSLQNSGKGINRNDDTPIHDYMRQLCERLRKVRVCCGEWDRVLTPSVTFAHGLTGVLLDPPYGEGELDYSAGGNKSMDVAHKVREWAVANGSNPKLRIALCGYEEQFDMPQDWSVEEWKTGGGYAGTAKQETQAQENRHRERIWFSPHCLPSTSKGFMEMSRWRSKPTPTPTPTPK